METKPRLITRTLSKTRSMPRLRWPVSEASEPHSSGQCSMKRTIKVRFTETQIALLMRAHPDCGRLRMVGLLQRPGRLGRDRGPHPQGHNDAQPAPRAASKLCVQQYEYRERANSPRDGCRGGSEDRSRFRIRYRGAVSEHSASARLASSASPGERFKVKARSSVLLHSVYCLS
jgi:hypothetical protein